MVKLILDLNFNIFNLFVNFSVSANREYYQKADFTKTVLLKNYCTIVKIIANSSLTTNMRVNLNVKTVKVNGER